MKVEISDRDNLCFCFLCNIKNSYNEESEKWKLINRRASFIYIGQLCKVVIFVNDCCNIVIERSVVLSSQTDGKHWH